MADQPLRLEWLDPNTLTPNPLNWRKHPKPQLDALRGVLDDVGWAGAALFNEATGHFVDGHARRDVAIERGEPLPVLIGSWTEAQEREILATLDPIAAMAEADAARLDELLRGVETTDAAVTEMLAELAKEAGLYQGGGDADAEPQIDRAAELQQQWQTATGQMWEMGLHRVICGDCTDRAVVERVMGGERATLMWTDPPYGIDHDTSWREDAGISVMGPQSAKGIAWDGNDDWSNVYASIGADVAFVWHASSHNIVVAQSLITAGYDVKQMIIWNKTVAPFGRSHYSYKHDPCWYAVRRGCTANWRGPNDEVTVWDAASPRHIMGGSIEEKTPHPTQKPIELCERPIRNHTDLGGIVADPFLGSGTTLIACHNLGRVCRGIEISPAYVAVILQRYQDATGETPVLAAG